MHKYVFLNFMRPKSRLMLSPFVYRSLFQLDVRELVARQLDRIIAMWIIEAGFFSFSSMATRKKSHLNDAVSQKPGPMCPRDQALNDSFS